MPIINHYGFGLVNVNEYTALVLGGYTLDHNSKSVTDKAYVQSFDMRMNRWHMAHTEVAARAPVKAANSGEATSALLADWPPLPVSICYVSAKFIDDHIILAGNPP